MLEGLYEKRVTGVFASHLHLLHTLPLNVKGISHWRMEVTDGLGMGPGRSLLQRERTGLCLPGADSI